MHGLIFVSFLEFMQARLGPDADEFRNDDTYRVNDAYADDEFQRLLTRAARVSGSSTADLLREFGIYAANVSFVNLYPNYYADSGDTRSFLLAIEDRIHELVRATIPGAHPPRLNVRPLGERGVFVTYTSDRGLCELVEGLVAGTAQYFHQSFAIEQALCMKRGDLACTFLVEPAPAS
jgi:hypothetical protein